MKRTLENKVVFERPDRSVEGVSLLRVVLEPEARTLDESQNIVRSLTDIEFIPNTFPVKKGKIND